MPGQIGTSIRANTRKIHSGDREADAIDAAGLAHARERFALLGRDVSQLSDDQLRNLVAELERRFRDEALTSAAQAATIILDGVKANRWRILVGADAHKIDETVRQSPERAYDIAFSTNSPARRGGPSASLSRTPICASRVDHRPICARCEDMGAGDAAAPFVSWPTRANSRTTYASRPRRDARCRWRHVISAPAPTGLDKAAPLKRSDAMSRKSSPTPQPGLPGRLCAVSGHSDPRPGTVRFDPNRSVSLA
jgi:hypothetical protein